MALALGALALAAAWLLGAVSLAPVGLGLLAAGLAARLWSRWAAGVELERALPAGRHVEGDDVVVEYRVRRGSAAALGGIRVQDEIGRLGRRQVRLGRGRSRLVLRAVPRGRYVFEQAAAVLEDPLALERVTVPVAATPPLVVEPRLVELGPLFTDAGRQGGDGARLLLRRPTGYDLHSVRDYEHGESLRKVHWPTTARRGRLMVKQLEDVPRDDVVVLLDCDARGAAGAPGSSSFDAQVRAAGSLVRAQASRGRRAALALGLPGTPMTRAASLDAFGDVLDVLAAVEAVESRGLADVLADARGRLAHASELVVVTARLEPPAADRLVGERGRRSALVFVDAPTFAGADPSPASPELLRLAAAGVAIAVVRAGGDLAGVLEAGVLRRVGDATA